MKIKENREVLAGTSLPVMEMFYTIQGEGYNTGKPCFFIRIAGCDVGCVWCDVKESWDEQKHPVYSIQQIVEEVLKSKAIQVVITGGEPTLYNLLPLTTLLKKNNILCFIETSGTNELTGTWQWICFSPKKFKPPVNSIFDQAHEMKIIVNNKHDLSWAKELALKINPKCLLYLQPEWSKHQKVNSLIIDFVKQNPNWRISLQTHKFLEIP